MRYFILLIFTLVFAASTMAAEDANVLLAPGTEAPTFSLPALDGTREALSIWNGPTLTKPHANSVKHVVIVNFWATYCKPCQKEIPLLSEFMKSVEGQPVKLFCISMDKEGAAIVKPFIDEKKYTVPVLLDAYGKTAERYGVKSVPALFVIGPDGDIRYAASGFDEKSDLKAKLASVVADALAGKKNLNTGVDIKGESVAVQAQPAAAPKGSTTAPAQAPAAKPAAVAAQSPAPQSTALPPGTEAPAFSLPALDGSREVLRTWSGKELLKPHVNNVPHTVIVSFWATYCKPCKKEIPELMAFAKKHADKPLKIFLISIDKEGAAKVAPFVKENGYTLPVLLDPYARTAQRYGVETVPALFVIGPDGVIRFSATGYDEKADLMSHLDTLIAHIGAGKALTSTGVRVLGESVAAQKVADPGAAGAASISARERWDAIVKVECGASVESVAEEYGVTADEIKAWYKDLKKTVMQMWGTPAPAGAK